MSNNKQSSIDFIYESLRNYVRYDNRSAVEIFDKIFEDAKSMHKDEITQAWKNGDGKFDKVAEQMSLEHYNEKYN